MAPGGSPHLSESRWGLPSARDMGAALIAEAGFELGDEPSAADLRALSFKELNTLGTGFWVPITGTVLPDEPGIVFASGKQPDVPYITGGNSFEGTIFRAFAMTPGDYFATFSEREEHARALYGADAKADTDAERVAAATSFGDQRYVISARYLAEQMKTVSSPARTYYFRFVPESAARDVPRRPSRFPRSPTSSAIRASPDRRPTAATTGPALADAMPATGPVSPPPATPNGDGRPGVARVRRRGRHPWMVLDAPEPKAVPGVLKDRLDLLEAVYLERVGGSKPGA